ncbi:hypothetical protein D3C72_1939940 [compost metagenome]
MNAGMMTCRGTSFGVCGAGVRDSLTKKPSSFGLTWRSMNSRRGNCARSNITCWEIWRFM